MYHVLVVDDERIIVDGLVQLFNDVQNLDLNVLRACSAYEALQIAERQRIDICFTDIRMPQMDGLTLQRKMVELWPRCRTVIISGYSDFDFVQTALRQGGLDYVLKTDGDDQILRSLHRAVSELREELTNQEVIAQAREHMRQALPLLQAELLSSVLEGRVEQFEPERFRELDLPISAERRSLLLLAQPDNISEVSVGREFSLELYSIRHLICDTLAPLTTFSIVLDQRLIAVFVQPAYGGLSSLTARAGADLARYVLGTMDGIQRRCRDLLGVRVSIVSSTLALDWDALPSAYRSLRQKLNYKLGHGRELLLTDEFSTQEASVTDSTPQSTELYATGKQLASALEAGNRNAFSNAIGRLFVALEAAPSGVRMEWYFSLAGMLSGHVNRSSLDYGAIHMLATAKCRELDPGGSLPQVREFFENWSAKIFDVCEQMWSDRTQKLIGRINAYVEKHLGSEISLTILSDMLHLNPSYLSRLYKQSTGIGLAEHVASVRLDRAWQLLSESDRRIGDIAREVGYSSATYFGRCFKRRFNLTPQELRDGAA